jgi:hypothetical protein
MVERVVPKLENRQITDQAVIELRENMLHSRLWHTPLGERLLKWFWKSSVGLRIAKRFRDAAPEELHGYAFWGPVIVAILVTELFGTGWLTSWFKDEWPWYTISATVGHLEDLESLVGVAVVTVIAATGFYAVTYASTSRPPSEGRTELILGRGRLKTRYGWPVVIGVTAIVGIVGHFALSLDRYPLSYAIYGSFAVLGILIPLVLVLLRKHVVFPSLPYTLNSLQARIPLALVVVVAGLSILVIHLTLYPWPDLARESASYAGLSSNEARENAAAELELKGRSPTSLVFSTQRRGLSGGKSAWLVYFLSEDGRYSGCVVAVTEKRATPTAACMK